MDKLTVNEFDEMLKSKEILKAFIEVRDFEDWFYYQGVGLQDMINEAFIKQE